MRPEFPSISEDAARLLPEMRGIARNETGEHRLSGAPPAAAGHIPTVRAKNPKPEGMSQRADVPYVGKAKDRPRIPDREVETKNSFVC